ncbi:acetyl-CoA carboxylase biotin carboxylase subunit family protein [Fusobacterium sp. IOR10]|uniref:ATP-grasp domain-containing protein n=1 Tax=Fusobacterium sp. IOR10 TaxID=2665157 RepID=UPI0013D615BD|nr:ATP-grasp domain-containing protein [Fusobacterium sp. IOR10]
MKKILLLGGSTQQIPAIECAKKQGYFTVLCDYLEDNPGQYHADKFYCVSTTDKESILKVAKKEKINGIVAYASDPAAPTAAYVAEKLNLPTNPYKSVEILAYKDKFRNFLAENNFNCPLAKNFNNFKEAKESLEKFKFPVMIKPVDSSGSKGVVKLNSDKNFEKIFNNSLKVSRNRKVIIEEFIEKSHDFIIGGDCFVIDGEVKFWGLLNCHRDTSVNPLVPVGKSYPLMISESQKEKIEVTINRLIKLLNINFGGFNLEMMFDKDDDLYLIEVGPRNGGNMIPDLLKIICDVDMVLLTIECAMGNYNINLENKSSKDSFNATHNIHSSKNGILNEIIFDDSLKSNIIKKVLYKQKEDNIEYFNSANKALGIVFFKFESLEEMKIKLNNINNLIKIDLM